jgi:hypothetical protein
MAEKPTVITISDIDTIKSVFLTFGNPPTNTEELTKENNEWLVKLNKVYPSMENPILPVYHRMSVILSYWIPYNRKLAQVRKDDTTTAFLDSLKTDIESTIPDVNTLGISVNSVPFLSLIPNNDKYREPRLAFERFIRDVGPSSITLSNVVKNRLALAKFTTDKDGPFKDDDFTPLEEEIKNLYMNNPLKSDYIIIPPVTPVSVVKTPSEDVEIPSEDVEIPSEDVEIPDDDVEIFVPVMGEEVDELIRVWELLKGKNNNKRLEMMVNEFIKERIGVIKDATSKNNVDYNIYDRTIQNPYKLTNEIRKLDQNGPTQNIEAEEESTEKQENVEAEEEPNEKQESTNKIEQTQNAEAEEESTEKQENDEDDNSTVATDVQPANQGLISTITNFVIPTKSKNPRKMMKKTKS